MSALSAVEAPIEDPARVATPGAAGRAAAQRQLRLVGQAAVPDRSSDVMVTPDGPEPRSSSIGAAPITRPDARVLTPSAVIPPHPVRARQPVSSPSPVRLTRRGRVVVAVLAVDRKSVV